MHWCQIKKIHSTPYNPSSYQNTDWTTAKCTHCLFCLNKIRHCHQIWHCILKSYFKDWKSCDRVHFKDKETTIFVVKQITTHHRYILNLTILDSPILQINCILFICWHTPLTLEVSDTERAHVRFVFSDYLTTAWKQNYCNNKFKGSFVTYKFFLRNTVGFIRQLSRYSK